MASKRSAIVFFLFLLLLYSIHWTHNHDAKISYPLLTIHFKWKTEQKSWYKYSGVAAIPMFKNTFCIIYNTAKQWELCCNSMFSGFLSLSCVFVYDYVYIVCILFVRNAILNDGWNRHITCPYFMEIVRVRHIKCHKTTSKQSRERKKDTNDMFLRKYFKRISGNNLSRSVISKGDTCKRFCDPFRCIKKTSW